jgi:hypothetical protein
VNVSRGTRHTDDRHDDVRSMQFVVFCCAVLLLLVGGLFGFALRGSL